MIPRSWRRSARRWGERVCALTQQNKMTCAGDLRIRAMRPEEIAMALDWAGGEDWNPGLSDAACFNKVDPDGFLIGELDGAPAAAISCLNYDSAFAFLGFYIVRRDLRGRGYGLRIWNEAIAHAGGRTHGPAGGAAQQQNFRQSGVRVPFSNILFRRPTSRLSAP